MIAFFEKGRRQLAGFGSGLLLLAGLIAGLPAQSADVADGPAKPWFQAATGPAYQVLVYSFADSNGDGWGDLNGLTARLDYLNDGQPGSGKSLDVSALWLSPINPSDSYHGYDVTDYKAVHPNLGTLADFDRLVAEAHKRGIRIVLDMVFNHTSLAHPWFKAMAADGKGPYANYYVKKDPKVTYGQGGMGSWYTKRDRNGDPFQYFAAFWEGMPDLNAANPAIIADYQDILAFWLARGVDGFRFDAAKHIFDTNELPQGSSALALNKVFWNNLRSYARGIKPDVWFLGEVTSDNVIEIRAYGGSLDSVFDFPDAKAILGDATHGSMFNLAGQDSGLAKAVATAFAQYSRADGFLPVPIFSNHDQDRGMSTNLNLAGASPVTGWGPEAGDTEALLASKRQGLNRSRLMAAMVQTIGGLPFIYYGEELGMTGRRYQNDDISRRDAFPWGAWTAGPAEVTTTAWQKTSGKLEPGNNRATPSAAVQDKDPSSLLTLYRRLAELRRTQPLLQSSAITAATWPGLNQGALVAWLRGSGAGQLLVVHNPGSAEASFAVPAGSGLRLVFDSGAVLPQGFRDPEPAAAPGAAPRTAKVTIPPVSTMVWTVVAGQ